jgi:hypothetical protein
LIGEVLDHVNTVLRATRRSPGPRAFVGSSALVFVSALVGCVAFPFATPPAQVEVGVGSRAIDAPEQTAPAPAPPPTSPLPGAPVAPRAVPVAEPRATSDTPIELHAGFAPLGFAESLMNRRADVVVGYVFQGGPLARIHGAYLHGDGVLGLFPLGASAVARIGLRVELRMVGEEETRRLGRGVAAGGFAELSTFTFGPFGSVDRSGGAVGVAYGEGGVGVSALGHYAQIDEITLSGFSVALAVRLPMTLGFVYKWGWPSDSKKSKSKSSSGSEEHEEATPTPAVPHTPRR